MLQKYLCVCVSDFHACVCVCTWIAQHFTDDRKADTAFLPLPIIPSERKAQEIALNRRAEAVPISSDHRAGALM